MPYRTQLAQILLGKNPELPSPLFKSQAEIAKLIVENQESGYDDQLNLRSFLNQVLIGKRRCNEKLADCIVAAASAKAPNAKNREKVTRTILQAIQTHNDTVQQYQARYPGEVTKGDVFERMSTKQRNAETVFIINMMPLELVPKSINAEKQQDLKTETIKEMLAGKQYVFCVPRKSIAILLWKAFYKEILESYASGNADDADRKLAQLEKDAVLTIYKIDEQLCVHSTVVYNAASPKTASGWIWYVPYKPSEVAEMPEQVLDNWTKEYFNPICAELLERQERISWNEARKSAIR